MAENYSISMKAAAKLDFVPAITAELMPLLHQAVRGIAAAVASQWREDVLKAKLWSVEKDRYAKSIDWRMTGDFSARVEADYDKAGEIETGRPARDLKKMLDTSRKVRRTKDGRRFLVIPMRHNTPGNSGGMPDSVYAKASQLDASKIVGQGQRRTGERTSLSPTAGMHPMKRQTAFLTDLNTKKHAMVVRNKYAWGGRLTGTDLKGLGLSAADRRKYKGLVRFDTSTPGGSKSSSYLTFRIMMDGQGNKWIVPAKPGLYLLQKVVDSIQPKAEAVFAAAAQQTISGLAAE